MAAPLAYSQTQTTSTSLPTTTGEYYKNLGVKKEEPTFETLLGALHIFFCLCVYLISNREVCSYY